MGLAEAAQPVVGHLEHGGAPPAQHPHLGGQLDSPGQPDQLWLHDDVGRIPGHLGRQTVLVMLVGVPHQVAHVRDEDLHRLGDHADLWKGEKYPP